MAQKKRRREMRELAGRAYRRELDDALSELEGEFARWRSGEISCHELSDLIHEFHDGIARRLWAQYTHLKPDQTVPIAVAKGVLAEDDLSAELLETLKQTIGFARELAERDADAEEADD